MNNYDILGLPAQATLEEARAAYRSLSMREHPLHQASEQDQAQARVRFEAIAQAYEAIRAQGHYEPDLDSDEVDQMFLEDMYELAKEYERGIGKLSGYVPGRTLVNVMVRQGCPESIAEEVVEELASDYDDVVADGEDANALPQGTTLHQLSWTDAEGYYAAALRVGDVRDQIHPVRYAELAAIRRRRGIFWCGLIGLLWLLVLGGTLVGNANADTLPAGTGVTIILLLLWRLTRNLSLGDSKDAFLREHRFRYYLRWCERLHGRLHTTTPGASAPSLPWFSGFNGAACLAGPLWLGYRRMPGRAWMQALLYVGVGVGLELVQGGRWASWIGGLWLLLSLRIGWMANRWYFLHLQEQINPQLQDRTAKAHTFAEGDAVNPLGWIIPVIPLWLGGMAVMILDAQHQAGLQGWDGFVQTAQKILGSPSP